MKPKARTINTGRESDFNRYLDCLMKKELELTEEIKKRADQDTPRVLDFFPEFRDKLNPPFANALDPAIGIPTLLPFYQTLVVNLSPFRDAYTFEKNYGLTISEMLDLGVKGRLVFVLNGYPKDYKNLSYLSPLVREFAVPTVIRFRNGYDEIAARGQYPQFKKLGESLFRGRISSIPKATDYLIGTQGSLDKVERGAIAGVIEMQIVGAQGAVEHIKEVAKQEPEKAAGLINTIYRPLFADHIYGSLAGQHALIRRPEYRMYCGELPPSSIFFISDEIGKSLISNLQVCAPADMQVFKDIDIEYTDFRKALCALDTAVSALQVKEAINQTAAIRKIWKKINNITRKEKYFQRLFQTIGVMGAFAVKQVPGPTLIQDVFPLLLSVSSIFLAEPASKVVTRLAIQSSLRIVFDLKKRIERS